MKHCFTKLFCLCLLVTACAPLHVREHEATKLDESAGQIKTLKTMYNNGLYYSIQSGSIRGNLVAMTDSAKKDQLKISINLIGNKGAVIKVNQTNLKYKYGQKEWKSVEGKVSSEQWQWEFGVSNGGKEFDVTQPVFFKDYVYSMEDKKGNEERLIFSVLIPMEEEDLEIEIPEIYLNGKLLIPKTLKFKWNDRWTLVPING